MTRSYTISQSSSSYSSSNSSSNSLYNRVPITNFGSFKISDNESVQPVDRVFLTYNYFDVDGFHGDSSSINREVIGFEKTFLDGRASFGIRAPFTQVGEGLGGDSEVDGLSLVFKYMAYQNRETGNIISAGLVVTVPTGPSIPVDVGSNINPTLIQPYLGYVFNVGRFYLQGFTEIIVPTDNTLPTFVSNDIGIGYRLEAIPVTPTFEIHSNDALNHQGFRRLAPGLRRLGDFDGRLPHPDRQLDPDDWRRYPDYGSAVVQRRGRRAVQLAVLIRSRIGSNTDSIAQAPEVSSGAFALAAAVRVDMPGDTCLRGEYGYNNDFRVEKDRLMKILVVGKGGREHALVRKLAASPRVTQIFCAPGNAGTARDGVNVPVEQNDLDKLLRFARKEAIDLTVVGPEEPLAMGIVDAFQQAGFRIFGPTKEAARLESSKVFAKGLMRHADVPTAEFRICDHPEPVVHLDPDPRIPGRRQGRRPRRRKGRYRLLDARGVLAAVERIMVREEFGRTAGRQVVIEKRLEGEELSILALVSGRTIIPLQPTQDHKAAFDGDLGPNTGGMGAYCPATIGGADLLEQIDREVLVPTVHAMNAVAGLFAACCTRA